MSFSVIVCEFDEAQSVSSNSQLTGTDGRGYLHFAPTARIHKRLRRFLLSLLTAVLALGSTACAKSKKEEHQSGRLNYVETLKYGAAGTHGSHGWYVSAQHFYVDGQRWSPPNMKMNDVARCEPSPNQSVEALKCSSFADLKESSFVLRMKDNRPEWVTVSSHEYRGGNNLGEWVGDGRWLLFRDYYFNVLTSERRAIKGLPDDPGKYFRAASPDLKTIIYEEYCFIGRPDLPDDDQKEKKTTEQCQVSSQHATKGVFAFWLIDAETGAVKILELKRDNYPTIDRGKSGAAGYNARFQELLTWKKDSIGKDELVSPTSD